MQETSSSIKSISILLVGMFTTACGIAMVTQAQLGTTPISTVPLVAAAISGLSFGTTTFLVNAVFVLIQKLIFGRHFNPINWLQIPLAFAFGLFLDVGMHFAEFMKSEDYLWQLALNMGGNAVLGLGIILEIRSKSIVLPGEGLVMALAYFFRKPFPKMKIINDVTLVYLAAVIGWLCLSTFVGIGQGTLISAICVGFFVKCWHMIFSAFNLSEKEQG